jgi:hypothetical protein
LQFRPYRSLHEFEALLFVNPKDITQGFSRPELLPQVERIRQGFPTPEDINDHPDTAPPARLRKLFPRYSKPFLGTWSRKPARGVVMLSLGKTANSSYILGMDSDLMTKCWPAALFLQQNPLARAAFEVVTKNLGISGYGIARQLDKNPTVIRDTLAKLRDKQLISGSAELTDNFTLTGVGFGVKEVFASHPELLVEQKG